MDVVEIVAWNLRRLRVARGLNQEVLAIDAAVNRTYVSKLERAVVAPSVVILDRLAIALSVEITEFFVAPKPGTPQPQILPKGRRPGRSVAGRKASVRKPAS